MKQIDKLILLEQSGELTARQKKKLDAMPEAQAKRDALAALTAAVTPPETEPSPWATTRIAAQLRTSRRAVWLPARVWSPVVALAACLTVIFNVVDFKPETPQTSVDAVLAEAEVWDAQFEADLVELENLILAISDLPLGIMEM